MENQPKDSQEKDTNRLCEKCRHVCKDSSPYLLFFCSMYDSGTAPRGIEENVVADVYVTNLPGHRAIIFLN